MRSIQDLKKIATESLDLTWSDVDMGSRLSLITLITDLEQAFIGDPWTGCKFIVISEGVATIFHDPKPLRIPVDIQKSASTYRELSKELDSMDISCIFNLEAIPELPGTLGSIFGFRAIVAIVHDEMRIRPYDASSGQLEYRGTMNSAMKTQWEHIIHEPFENFLHRLFIPISEDLL